MNCISCMVHLYAKVYGISIKVLSLKKSKKGVCLLCHLLKWEQCICFLYQMDIGFYNKWSIVLYDYINEIWSSWFKHH